MCADDTVGKPFVAHLSLSLKCWNIFTKLCCTGRNASLLGITRSLRDPLVDKSFSSSFQWLPRDQWCKLTSESVMKFMGPINIHEMSLILFDYVNRYGIHYQILPWNGMFVCFVKTKQLKQAIQSAQRCLILRYRFSISMLVSFVSFS